MLDDLLVFLGFIFLGFSLIIDLFVYFTETNKRKKLFYYFFSFLWIVYLINKYLFFHGSFLKIIYYSIVDFSISFFLLFSFIKYIKKLNKKYFLYPIFIFIFNGLSFLLLDLLKYDTFINISIFFNSIALLGLNLFLINDKKYRETLFFLTITIILHNYFLFTIHKNMINVTNIITSILFATLFLKDLKRTIEEYKKTNILLTQRIKIIEVFLKLVTVTKEFHSTNLTSFNKAFIPILRRILTIIITELKWQGGAIYLNSKKEDKKIFVLKITEGGYIPLDFDDVYINSLPRNQLKSMAENKYFSSDDIFIKTIEEAGEILYISSPIKHFLHKHMDISSYIKNIMIIPLYNNNQMFGFIVLENNKNDIIKIDDYVHLASLISLIIDNFISSINLSKEYARSEAIKREMDIARQIQLRALPDINKIPKSDELEFVGISIPAQEIGGDYYDIIKLEDEKIAFMIGDISGKGLVAGILMLILRTLIHAIIYKTYKPKEFVINLNNLISQYLDLGKFITFLYLLWDPKEKKFYYTDCGHEKILIYRHKSNRIDIVKERGIAFGILPVNELYAQKVKETTIELNEGDIMLLYTDGVTEAKGLNPETNKEEFFGLENLQDVFFRKIKECNNNPDINKLKNYIIEEIKNFSKGFPQHDDITLVIIKRKVNDG